MNAIEIRRRAPVESAGWPADLHPLLARIYALRGLDPAALARSRLADLVPPEPMAGLAQACEVLADAIARDLAICVVGDFDADGATGTAVAVRGLRLLGARRLSWRVPHRAREGYGLSPALVDSLQEPLPDLILTVDNGIAAHAGVAAAAARGMRVIVTDHHLPGATLPAAAAIVNPNLAAPAPRVDEPIGHDELTPLAATSQANPLRQLCGAGVMFYLLLALRARLQRREVDLASVLDLVALGTVADLVALDHNNRILVAAGLRRIRARRCCAGILALLDCAGRDPARTTAADLGYVLGPRINAAGRLEDMGIGIECLLSDDAVQAADLAARLSAINTQRQELQADMVEQGEALVASYLARHGADALPHGVVLHEADWHPGVVGLVASRLKERLHRPVVACAPAAPGSSELRASARSIAGFHLRDALAEVDARCPGLIARFGGHAMAAGLTLEYRDLARFAAEFDAVARRHLDPQALERFVWSDGELAVDEFTAAAAHALRYGGPWGQGFAEPQFDNEFTVESVRVVGDRHLKLRLRPPGGEAVDAIAFGARDCLPLAPRLRALFQLDLNDWNGRESLQLLIRQLAPA
ncbi:DHHA1 domain-containing protein [Dokdonella sp.]|uniref:single-stranded-DNA-specific exonuclease RecJ n=1 Tax=Dokdonella sp. TaxID=2291710 RepID=UPI0027B8C785|nr:DHHA1 domain-containing protein [Dokdonella sp.]